MIINMVGGSASTYAFIVVTYPSGSVCTCSNGSITLTATDTSGSFVFPIPSAGTWTVSCTDGTDVESKSTSVTYHGQSLSIELNYGYYILKDGVWVNNFSPTKLSGGYGTNTISYTSTSNSLICTVKEGSGFYTQKLDVTQYNHFYIDAAVVEPGSAINAWLFEIVGDKTSWTDATSAGAVVAQRTNGARARTTVDLDISNVTGEQRFTMSTYMQKSDTVNPYYEIFNIWVRE